MATFKYIQLIVLLILAKPVSSLAQSDSTKKDEFSASVNYQSALHYFGRTDSLQSSGLFPIIGYQLKSGLYAQGTFIFIQNPSLPTTYTGAAVEAGYRFPQSKNFNGNIFFTKFLYKDNSTLVQSALQYQTGINFSYTNSIININTGIDMKYSSKADFGATAGADHIFIFKIKNKPMAFAIDPSVYGYFGTQNFSETYNEKKNFLGIPVTRQVTANTTTFNILSYEISVPVVFVAGKFNAAITPAYVMPQNLLAGENGKNLFYVTCSIGVRL